MPMLFAYLYLVIPIISLSQGRQGCPTRKLKNKFPYAS